MSELTPMMRQYRALKDQHPRAILLFRLGDFFEAFFEDAHLVARELQLTLTSRPVAKGRRIPMCGIPHHALRTYLRRLIDRGHRVAICDQVEDPRQAGSLVRREVVRVVTPGTVIEDDLLSARENNFLASTLEHGEAWGLALADLSTGEFYAAEGSTARHLEETLARFRPREILVPDGASGAPAAATPYDGWRFDLRTAERALCEQLGVATLDAFGLRDAPLATAAAGALVQYLRETQKGSLPHLRGLRLIAPADGLVIDEATRRALALWRVPGEAHGAAREALRTRLRALGDLERLTGRLAHEAGSPRDLAALRDTLEALPSVAPCLDGLGPEALRALAPALAPPPGLAALLRRALADDAPPSPKEGGVIRPGFDPELDELRAGVQSARQWMAGLEAAERARTGIRSLKVGYNQVQGYYIEVSKANSHLVPREYVRKGTLVGAERYVTAELKEKEALILTAQERINAKEYEVFCSLREQVRAQAAALLACARALAEVDVLASLAEASVRYDYVRPRVTDGRALRIAAGRHPVVELSLRRGSGRPAGPEQFVPNDLVVGADGREILIVTGPNFGGKSTYIRQAALIVILAQMGSFVPAREAEVGLVDRIFTRVGASDDLAAGRSTFLSEMIEVGRILTQATARSLVILDEVGRGTSTYDGMSLAWAVVEDLHDRIGVRTLFATHYHELTELASQLEGVANRQVLVHEDGPDIVFLHRVADGAAGSSYGIHVARLAGVPDHVVRRAREVLGGLERHAPLSPAEASRREKRRGPSRSRQLALPLASAVEEALRQVDVATMTPLEALNFLSRVRALLGPPEDGGEAERPAAEDAPVRRIVPFPPKADRV